MESQFNLLVLKENGSKENRIPDNRSQFNLLVLKDMELLQFPGPDLSSQFNLLVLKDGKGPGLPVLVIGLSLTC